MDRSKALAALSALAHETRLELIRLLTPQGDAGMSAGQIAETLGIAAPRLSFHLCSTASTRTGSGRRSLSC
jgi:ArsR family transcriptional regulator